MIYLLITAVAFSFAWLAYRYEKLLIKNNEILENYNTELESELQKRTAQLTMQKKQLEDSEFRWKFAVDGNGDGLWDWNVKTNEVYFSKRWKEMLGFTENEIKASLEEWEKRVHPDDLQEVYKDISKHIEGKSETYQNEHRVLCKNGKYKWILDRGIVVQRDDDGSAIRFIGTHSDIDERKEIQVNLEKANIKFSSIYNNSLDPIFLFSIDRKKFDDLNPKACELYGYSKDEFLNLGVKDIEVLHDDNKIKKTHEDIIKYGWKRFESKHKLKDGTIIDVMVTAVFTKLFDKEYIYVSTRDISLQKQSENTILKQKEEFETIFQYAQDGIAITDLKGCFIKVNPSFERLTEYSESKLLELDVNSLVAPEDKENNKKAIVQVIKAGTVENFEQSYITASKQRKTINLSLSLLPDKKSLLLTVKDTSSLKVNEEQTRLASMGEMIGNIAHQWRQPLSALSTAASGMKVKSEFGIEITKKDIVDFSDYIITHTQYLSKTIDNFRNFLKGDKNYSNIKIEDILETTFSLTNATIKNNNISLICEIEENIMINGSINELSEAFINIINNSKDVLKEKVQNEKERFIFIKAKKNKKGAVEISFKDSGGGIPENIIHRVFEPYFTSKHQSVGTGLGLSMVDKIIRERHKGQINVQNEEFVHDGKKYRGACFTITLKLVNTL